MLTKESLNTILHESCKTCGDGLDGIFKFVFAPLIKCKIKKEHELEEYKKQIYNATSSIPEENLIEPPLNIVGPALEASKFYIDEKEIRNMFANLIASSMNSKINEYAHPSFIEIIKQLSSLDAQILTNFTNTKSIPIVKFRLEGEFYRGADYKTHIINNDADNLDSISLSISNLIRLGVIDVSYLDILAQDSHYSEFYNHPTYLSMKNFLDSTEFNIGINEFKSLDSIFNLSPNKIKIVKGIASLTPLGQHFISICL